MKHYSLLLVCFLVAQTSAQSSDLLSILISQGYSVFTSITASLGQTTVTGLASSNFPSSTASDDLSSSFSTDVFDSTTAPSTTVDLSSSLASLASSISSASASITSSLASASLTSASASASALSSLSSVSASASAAVASATSAAASSGGNNRDRTLAIVLGTVLGALALGLFLLLLVILCHRRRRRRAYGRGSLSSTSDEALTSHKAPGSHVAPLAATRTSGRRSLRRHNHATQPSMMQRSGYDVPSAHQFGHGDTVPFVPTGTSNRSSRVLPTERDRVAGTGLGSGNRFPDGNGLNNHPYHDNHHTGSMLAAGAGGAALGAAAARRSRSGERHHGPRLSGDHDVHPAYWDEPPPPRSPNRTSVDSARRSGSMPRGTFYGPTDHANSPLRNSLSAAPAGPGTGIAAAVAADRTGRRSHERGRSLHPELSPSPGYSTDTTLAGSQSMPHGAMGTYHGTGPVMNTANPPLTGRGHPHPNGSMAPAVGAAAIGAGLASHSRSRSRSGPHPPLPPLVTGNGHQRRSYPSRSPKRTRFSGGDMYHEPMPYENGPHRDGAISPPAANVEPMNTVNPMTHPAHRSMIASDDPVSPVSREDMLRAPSRRTPGHANRYSRLSDPSPTPSVSPQIVPPGATTTTTTTTTTAAPPTNSARNSLPSRQHSGLVNAVQDHFDPNNPSQHHHHQPPPYQPFISETIRPSAFSNPDTTAIPTTRPPKPLSRKPVPFSEYNNARYQAVAPDPGEPRRSGENWWRGEEDSAWAQSYSTPGIGRAR